jgi:predicted nucleic acid-binding protein
MTRKKIIIHTDVFLGHLTCKQYPSLLRTAMSKCFCYTTVFQAIELFALADTEYERRVVEDVMAAMKVLGVNPKNARRYGDLLTLRRNKSIWSTLIGGLCVESKLPLLTEQKYDFAGIPGLQILSPRMLMKDKI